jgi:hypothetical protein
MGDAELITELGGPAKVAELLALTEPGAVQRVSNWKRRGIPPRVRLDFPQVFARPELINTEGAPDVPAAAEPAAQEAA